MYPNRLFLSQGGFIEEFLGLFSQISLLDAEHHFLSNGKNALNRSLKKKQEGKREF